MVHFSLLSYLHHLKSIVYRDNIKIAVLVENGRLFSLHSAAMMPILP